MGGAYYALKYAYILENKRFNVDDRFNYQWIQKIRNGHFYIDRIKNIKELKEKRIETAFWFSHLINALGDKGVL